jgi:hypothetical protein
MLRCPEVCRPLCDLCKCGAAFSYKPVCACLTASAPCARHDELRAADHQGAQQVKAMRANLKAAH